MPEFKEEFFYDIKKVALCEVMERRPNKDNDMFYDRDVLVERESEGALTVGLDEDGDISIEMRFSHCVNPDTDRAFHAGIEMKLTPELIIALRSTLKLLMKIKR